MYSVLAFIIDLIRKTYIYLITLIATSVLSVALNLVLINIIGIKGAAITCIIVNLIQFVVVAVIAGKTLKFKLPFLLPQTFFILIATAVMILAAILTYNKSGILNFALVVLLSAGLYFGTYFGLQKFWVILNLKKQKGTVKSVPSIRK